MKSVYRPVSYTDVKEVNLGPGVIYHVECEDFKLKKGQRCVLWMEETEKDKFKGEYRIEIWIDHEGWKTDSENQIDVSIA